MLTESDLSRIIRPHVAHSGLHVDFPAFRDMRSIGLKTADVIAGICNPQSHVVPIAFVDEPAGRGGFVVCPTLNPPSRVLLWVRDDPLDPPMWVELRAVARIAGR